MSENSSPLSSPDSFHEEIVRIVDSKNDSKERADAPSREVSPHPEGGAAFERELTDRMVVRKRRGTSTSGTPGPASLAAASGSVRNRSRGGGGTVLLVLLGLILVFAGYIAFFDDGDGAEYDSQRVNQGTSRPEIPEPSRRSTGPINYFNVAIDGFDQLLAERIDPEYKVSQFSQLRNQLQSEIGRTVSFTGASVPLIGGDVTEVRTLSLPRFFFRGEGTVMIVVEVPWEDLVAENGVYVAEDIRQQLESGETVFTPGPSNGTIALYREGESAVIAVADRSEPDLAGILGL